MCNVCNKAFGRSDHLSKHLKTHDSERKKAMQQKGIEDNCTKLFEVNDEVDDDDDEEEEGFEDELES